VEKSILITSASLYRLSFILSRKKIEKFRKILKKNLDNVKEILYNKDVRQRAKAPYRKE